MFVLHIEFAGKVESRIKTKTTPKTKLNAKISMLEHYGMGYTIRNLFSLLDISLFDHFFLNWNKWKTQRERNVSAAKTHTERDKASSYNDEKIWRLEQKLHD